MIIIGITNGLQDINTAFLSSGRFDTVIEMSEPKTKKDSTKLFNIYIRKIVENNKVKENVNFDNIIIKNVNENFSTVSIICLNMP